MEVRNYFPSPFVRRGFGRVSTTSSSYQSSDNLNGVDEMSHSKSDDQKLTVKHCISKYNKSFESEEKTVTKREEKTESECSKEFFLIKVSF